MKTLLLFTTITFLTTTNYLIGQCANSGNIYSFIYNGKSYEVVKENKTWIDAATCAVERGGILTEVNDAAEQSAIFNELNLNAGIVVSNTVAPDGGGGSYVWIGGNDLLVEGNWIWDGDNDNNGSQFWMGTASGNPVGGLYNNWGNEPDDFSGQDALGMSLNGWPLGVAGEWNDVDHTNLLYYVIEHPAILGSENMDIDPRIIIFPNHFVDYITIESIDIALATISVYNELGQIVKTKQCGDSATQKVDLTSLDNGVYILQINTVNGKSINRRIIK